MDDHFIQDHDASELEIAGEFLTNWLPFLTRDLCDGCSETLTNRVRSLRQDPPTGSPNSTEHIEGTGWGTDLDRTRSRERTVISQAPDSSTENPNWSEHIELTEWGYDPEPSQSPEPTVNSLAPEPTGWGTDPEPDPSLIPGSPKVRMSWADMAQEDELAEEEENARERGESEEAKEGEKKKIELSREQREWIRYKNVARKKDFICLERVRGKLVNILEGLELHTGVFSAVEQKRIVDFVYELQEKGRKSELRERTYSEPHKWMKGKGRITIQFGCCYNYAMDKEGNPPGILHNTTPDPIPNLFKVIVRRLVRWRVLPTSCVPDSCIVNIYEPGDCIPPHIDSHDFVRPFSTVSFLSECNILFGSNLKIEGPGEFSGSTAIPLPVGSVLVLNGNGADVAKHCVPAVPTKRISITFRKMDPTKHPIGFSLEPDLQNIQQLPSESTGTSSRQRTTTSIDGRPGTESRSFQKGRKYEGRPGGTQLYEPEMMTPNMRPRQVIDVRSTSSSNSSSYGRGGWDSGERLSDLKPRQHLQDVRNEPFPARRSPRRGWGDDDGNGGGQFEVGAESSGRRRVRLDQKRIVISRNLEGDEEMGPTGSQGYGHGQRSRGPASNGRRRFRVVVADDQ